MRPSRSRKLADTSVEAMVSAIEIYNKPGFLYRAEAFSILSVNAWELLLKARVLSLRNNDLSSIYLREPTTNKDGSTSKRKRIKRNRAGAPLTIGFERCLNVLQAEKAIDLQLVDALKALKLIRDSSVHFLNSTPRLEETVQQLGSASLQNYSQTVDLWFGIDLSQYNFFLMPLTFFPSTEETKPIATNKDGKQVLDYVLNLHNAQLAGNHDVRPRYAILQSVEVKLKKSRDEPALKITYGDDHEASPVYISDDDRRESHPWTYTSMVQKLRKRYTDLKTNARFHEIKEQIKHSYPECVTRRYLDPDNTQGTSKEFFSRDVLNVFDRHYTRRT